MNQRVSMKPAKQAEYPDVGKRSGVIERVHYSRREVTVGWIDLGVRINLTFDEIEAAI